VLVAREASRKGLRRNLPDRECLAPGPLRFEGMLAQAGSGGGHSGLVLGWPESPYRDRGVPYPPRGGRRSRWCWLRQRAKVLYRASIRDERLLLNVYPPGPI